MIGFYDYTVVTSFLGIVSAVIGMTEAFNEHFIVAIICLTFCALCDTLDGKIARTKKNRTPEEKEFGIQLDSLCDIVCFGAFPVVMAYKMGMNKPLGIAILCAFLICGVIRLAYFNVMEERRQIERPNERKVYYGVPITTISIALSIAYVIGLLIPPFAFYVFLHVLMLIFAVLYIVNIKIPKPNTWLILGICIVVLAFLIVVFVLIRMGIIIPQEVGTLNGIGKGTFNNLI